MKRFRFPLEQLLALKRRRLEEVESELSRIESRRASSRRRAELALSEAEELRSSTAVAARLSGAELRAADSWIRRLGEIRAAAAGAEKRLGEEARARTVERIALFREVRTLEDLRARRFKAYQDQEERELQALAEDVHRSRRARQRRRAAAAQRNTV